MQVLGEHDNNVKAMLNTFGVALKPSSFKKDVRPLLKEACTAIFGTAAGVVDMMVKNVPSSKAGSAIKVCAAARPSIQRQSWPEDWTFLAMLPRCNLRNRHIVRDTFQWISRVHTLAQSCAEVSKCGL